MDTIHEINAGIIDIYEEWRNEIKTFSPHLLTEEFSNIFCTGVSENWISSDMRIIIVGEEATWKSRKNYNYNDENELQECQQWILNELCQQLYNTTVQKHSSPFWRRIRAIQKAFPDASICWTNIDVINSENCRALCETDRKLLHSCKTQILREVVELLKPTHIVFFGWHNTSLKHEFPELSEKVYPENYGDTGFMKENGYIYKTNYKNITVVFTYHPSWITANSNNYIKKLINILAN